MDGGAWQTVVHSVAESDMTETTWQVCMQAISVFHYCKTSAFIHSLTTQIQEYDKVFEIF